MAAGRGGHELLALYTEGITKMPENPGIPLLFRDIFKNAFLPYRDPETLKMFLKVIDEFTYDHSERLGDAFEYLLSVLGSQGDAGQFRTPRHIIDFIVEVIDPQKTDAILDPACGTAGFLISSYKHILRANTNAKGQSKLTPDQKGKLAQNIKGYDISPDMVRLSLVNLYLHGFTNPHIDEYDTLTSEDKWNEFADVILANPPFMSPKGGIKPHKRFSVQSKRSEVLFADYMAEHLTPTGRAGFIVPEGIIFQTQTAYKELRKMLVENSLVAVISLPAGVFNPYSGVKTSILILNKPIAKQSDTIAFFKIENDGFSLGAQRRQIQKNDLPQAKAEIGEYLRCLRQNELLETFKSTIGLIVPKEKIAANGDYNLSGERYRENEIRQSIFPLRRFEDVCTLEYGSSLPKDKRVDGPYPVVGSNGITGYHNEYIVEGPAIIIGRKGSAGEVSLIEKNCFPIDTTFYVKQSNPSETDIRYLYALLKTLNLSELKGGAGIPGLNRSDVYNTYQIPFPPVEVQKEIVAEIESYQNVIDGARAVIDNYRPHISIHPDWPLADLGSVCDIKTGKLNSNAAIDGGAYPFFTCSKDVFRIDRYAFDCEAILLSGNNASGDFDVKHYQGKFNAYQRTYVITVKKEFLGRMTYGILKYVLNSNLLDLKQKSIGGLTRYLTLPMITSIKLPLPPLATQQSIVAEIEAEQALVAANQKLIIRFKKKIQGTIARVWGEEEPTSAET